MHLFSAPVLALSRPSRDPQRAIVRVSAPRAQRSEPRTRQSERGRKAKSFADFGLQASSTRLREWAAKQIAPAQGSKGRTRGSELRENEARRLANERKRPEGGIPQAMRRVPGLARKAKRPDAGQPQVAPTSFRPSGEARVLWVLTRKGFPSVVSWQYPAAYPGSSHLPA